MRDRDETTIVLVGRSGVGKSTLGPLLADALGYRFFDVDQEIADLPHAPPLDARLREQILTSLCAQGKTVIAAGFGDVDEAIMSRALKERVMTVWLKAVTDGRDGRTLRMFTKFEALSTAEQNAIFSHADVTVDLGSLAVEAASAVLISAVLARQMGRR